MSTSRRQVKKKHTEEKVDNKAKLALFDFTEDDEKKELSGSDEEVREGNMANGAGWNGLSVFWVIYTVYHFSSF